MASAAFSDDLIADLGAMLGARMADAVRVVVRAAPRADFAGFLLTARALLALFLAGRRAALDDRPAVLVEWLLINII
ncbi:MAG TPA: hypothetical protein VMG39_04640 [Pseudolabrys sp.]|nr:hypothetical protein [Pseudolabrys sp.]